MMPMITSAAYRPALWPLPLALLLSLASSPVHATMAENLSIGNPRALALGNAVTALDTGVDAIHYNPAALTTIRHNEYQVKAIAGDFGLELAFGDYTPTRTAFIQGQIARGIFTDDYFADEARNSTSEVDGATLMLPWGGLTDAPVLAAPSGGVAWRPEGSRFTFANGVFAPLIFGFNRDDNDPGRFIGQRLGATVLTWFAPSIGWEVSDQLSLGASVTFNYAGIGLELPFRTPHIGIPILYGLQEDACNGATNGIACLPREERVTFTEQLGQFAFEVEERFTPGYHLGLLWTPDQDLSVGLNYQSRIRMDMTGDFQWINGDNWDQFATAMKVLLPAYNPTGTSDRYSGHASVDLSLPEHLAAGIRWQAMPKVSLSMDVRYTRWSRWEEIPIRLSTPLDYLTLAALLQPDLASPTSIAFPLNLEDTVNAGIGIEYAWSPTLTLRAGLEDRPSSVPASDQSPLLPIGDGLLHGIGFGWTTPDQHQFDASLAWLRTTTRMPGNTSPLGNSENPALVIYNPYQGTDINATLEVFMLQASWTSRF
jgi:long-subunit fatty acid transport protein